ncbi:hypothetical protein ACIRST_38555, partial [Kitasatospora sp. NPDC101447]
FSGSTVLFKHVEFAGGVVDFGLGMALRVKETAGPRGYEQRLPYGAVFADGRLSFDGAEFQGATVMLQGAKFKGGVVDLSHPQTWARPPSYPDLPQPGLLLPAGR